MKKINALLVLFIGLFFLPLAGQTLLEDAQALNHLLTSDATQAATLNFEILERLPKLSADGGTSFEKCEFKEGNTIEIRVKDNLMVKWLAEGDSLKLLESTEGLTFNRKAFKVADVDIATKNIALVINNYRGAFSMAYINPTLSEDEFFDDYSESGYTDKVDHLIFFPNSEDVTYDIREEKQQQDNSIMIYPGSKPVEANKLYFEYANPQKIESDNYYIGRLAPKNLFIRFKNGQRKIKDLPINTPFQFSYQKDKNQLIIQTPGTEEKWKSYPINLGSFTPRIGVMIGQSTNIVDIKAGRETPNSYYFRDTSLNLLDNPTVSDKGLTLRLITASSRDTLPANKLQPNVLYELNIQSKSEQHLTLSIGGVRIDDIPMLRVLSANGYATSPSVWLQFMLKEDKLLVRRPVLTTRQQFIPVSTEKDLKVISLLGRHSLLKSAELQQANLHGIISDNYRQNKHLNRKLANYFSKGLGNTKTTFSNNNLQAAINANKTSYEWQQVLANEKKLDLSPQASYREVIDAYRTPINTAADNLQLASEQFENGSKKLRKGFNASNIAAGLSDFVVERAQEELNLTFLNRLRGGILNDTSEFKKLFPATRSMLVDFEVDKYQTLLDFAKKAFVQDLQNLGLNFPKLFELQKYEQLKNDPNVFNIFLIYDIANQIYEDTPIEEVLLKLYERLGERQFSLNQSINLALADTLQKNNVLRRKLIQDLQNYTNEINQLDQHIDASRRQLLSLLPPAAQNSRSKSPTDFVNQLNRNVPTRRLMADAYEAKKSSGEHKELSSVEAYILLEGPNNHPNVSFQQYETLTPLHLTANPAYWYTLKKLPFAETKVFFDEDLPPKTVIATGINQIRQLLTSKQETVFATWLNRLEDGMAAVKIKRAEYEANNLKKPIDDLQELTGRRAAIYSGLLLELKFWENLKNNNYQTKDGQLQQQHIIEHDYQAVKYLVDVFENPKTYNLYDWSDMDELNAYLLKKDLFPNNQIEAEIFVQELPVSIHKVVAEGTKFIDDFLLQIQDRILKLQANFQGSRSDFLQHYDITSQYHSLFMNLPANNSIGLAYDYYQTVDTMKMAFDKPLLMEPLIEELPPATVPVNVLLASCDQLSSQQATNAYNYSKDQDFNQLNDEIQKTRTELQELLVHKKALFHQFYSLENRYTNQLFQARQHADQLSKLTELTTHVLYALKAADNQNETIITVDSVFQQVKKIQTNDNGTSVEITYDSLTLRQRTIAKGKDARRWIQPSQLLKITQQDGLKDAFFGLLSERLAASSSHSDYSQKNLKLLVNKAVFAINEVDEQTALLRHKQATNQVLSFSDYYPFIRTTVDLLNVVLTTPLNADQAVIDRFPKLTNLPKISDESLSLFENVFAEKYPDAIHNVMRLLAIIWEVDMDVALANIQQKNASLVENNQGKQPPLKKITRKKEKKNKQIKSALLVYGSFMAHVVAAQNASQVKAAIRSVAVPPGSSSVKRKTKFNVSFNAYFGVGFHRENLNNSLIPESQQIGNTVGLSVPVGVSASLGALGKNNNWGLSLFVPILDIGGVTAFRLSDDGSTGELPELTFSNLISPGGYLMVNFPKSPFSVGIGAQYGPQVRKITINEAEINSSAWKFGITASIDVPIFNLFSR